MTSTGIKRTGQAGSLLGLFRHGSGEFEELSNTARFWTSTANGYGYPGIVGLIIIQRRYTVTFQGSTVGTRYVV